MESTRDHKVRKTDLSVRIRPAVLTMSLIVLVLAPAAVCGTRAAAPGNLIDGCIDRTVSAAVSWAEDKAQAIGLAAFSTGGSDLLSIEAAADVAAHDASLHLKRLLYGLPVTANENLGIFVSGHSVLRKSLDRFTAGATIHPPATLPPDLVLVRMDVELSGLRKLLAPVLLGRAPVAEAMGDRAGTAAGPADDGRPAERSGFVLVLPPEGTNFTPPLVPVFLSGDAGRTQRLRAAIGLFLLAGGRVRYVYRWTNTEREGTGDTRIIRAVAAAGAWNSALMLTDTDADRLAQILSNCNEPSRQGMETAGSSTKKEHGAVFEIRIGVRRRSSP